MWFNWLKSCIWPPPPLTPPHPSFDFKPCSFPAQQTDHGAKCSPAYQTTRLHPGDNQSDFITVELNSPSKRMADIYVLWLFGCSWAITLLINQWLSLPPASILAGSLLGSPLMFCYKCCGGQDAFLLWLIPPDMRVRSQSALGAAVNSRMHQYLCKMERAIYPPSSEGPRLLS